VNIHELLLVVDHDVSVLDVSLVDVVVDLFIVGRAVRGRNFGKDAAVVVVVVPVVVVVVVVG